MARLRSSGMDPVALRSGETTFFSRALERNKLAWRSRKRSSSRTINSGNDSFSLWRKRCQHSSLLKESGMGSFLSTTNSFDSPELLSKSSGARCLTTHFAGPVSRDHTRPQLPVFRYPGILQGLLVPLAGQLEGLEGPHSICVLIHHLSFGPPFSPVGAPLSPGAPLP